MVLAAVTCADKSKAKLTEVVANAEDYRLSHKMAGTVTANRSVEIRSIEADSASAALYRAAKSTTMLDSGKLQHRRESLANGLTTCNPRSSAKKRADCTDTLAREPRNTPPESSTGCAASTRPTAKTATPEVADPIRSKQAATGIGKW